MVSLVSAFIVGVLALLGTVITARTNFNKTNAEIDKHMAVQNEKISELTREIRGYETVINEVPVLKQRIVALEKTTFG
jgi:hypothetical protein